MFGKCRTYIITCGIILLPAIASAQLFHSSNYWKQYRREIAVGLGVSNFLGDLGGRDQIGSDFIYDLELQLTKFSFYGSYGYYLTERSVWRGDLIYGNLWGDDKLTLEPYRHNRNLNFKSILIELSTRYEYHFITEKMGHRYNLKKARGMKGFIIGFYGFAGVGAFYFNPKGLYGGQWIPLQPLGTEGQGLYGTHKYLRFNMSIPMGFGFKYAINYQWRLGVEVGYHKTFTDYVDDVSTVYIDNDTLNKYHGPVAAYMSNPSLGMIVNGKDPTAAGNQRGDQTDKDAFIFSHFTISYKLPPKRRKYKRTRRRRSLPSF